MAMFGFRSWDDDGDDGPMFGPKMGSWALSSKLDPRFNLNGRCQVGGFQMPDEARAAMKAKAKELGCSVPADLEFEYMKD